MIVDIKRAYCYAPAQQPLYVKLPPEDPMAKDPETCGKLLKSLYGTRDAGANWHAAYSSFLLSLGFEQGAANPCHFICRDWGIKGLAHGDDFLYSGTKDSLANLRRDFEKQYECKVETIGYDSELGCSARFLNRVISYTSQGIEFEADQRLVEAMVNDLNLIGSKATPTPGTKPRPIAK